MENCAYTFESWVQVLLIAQVTYKELHLGVVKALVDIKYIDSIASRQQLLHHVLPQDPRASNHCALLSLKNKNGKRTKGVRTRGQAYLS